jgi:hypothetical protein
LLFAPTPTLLADTLTAAIGIAPQLIDDAGWIWLDAYWPPGRNPDRPTRLAPRPDPGDDPDSVPGDRLALGLGNDAPRKAYTKCAAKVAEAHRLAARAHGHYTGRPSSGARVRPPRGTELAVMVDAVTRRLAWLLERDIAHDEDDQPRLDAHAAAVALMAAHAELRTVLRDVDGSGEPPPERRCVDCGKACEDQKRKRCWQCVQRRARGKKPVRRWAEAHAAKERRAVRGEDHAENPLPGGRYIEGEWEAS